MNAKEPNISVFLFMGQQLLYLPLPRLPSKLRADESKALGQPKSSVLSRILSPRQTLGRKSPHTGVEDKLGHLHLRWNRSGSRAGNTGNRDPHPKLREERLQNQEAQYRRVFIRWTRCKIYHRSSLYVLLAPIAPIFPDHEPWDLSLGIQSPAVF